MKSKTQKEKEVAKSTVLADDAKALVFVNFSQTPVSLVDELKASLRDIGATFKVMKKTLFGLVFKQKNINVDVLGMSGQIATVFSTNDIVDAAGTVYRFTKAHKDALPGFAMVAGYDIQSGTLYDAAGILELGKLPSRDVLLAQLLGMLNAPIRSFAVVLSEIAKQKEEGAPAVEPVASDEKAETAPEESVESTETTEDQPEEVVAEASPASEETTEESN